MRTKLIPLLLFFCASAPASRLKLDLRYEVSATRANTTAETVLFEVPLHERVIVEAGGRVSGSLTDLHALHWKGSAAFLPVSFFRFDGRLHHGYRFQETTATTHLLGTATLQGGPDWLEGFFTFGWYERFGQLGDATILPTFTGADRREHDFAAAIGLKSRFYDSLAVRAQIATFEEVEVYNLNNPFLEARLFYELPDIGALEIYFRYRVTLGFGRWEELSGGGALTLPLSSGK